METRHRRHSRKHSRKNNRFRKTIRHGFHTVKTTSKKGFDTVKSASKKYMPRVKSGLENVGSKVTKTATKSVPVLQKASRDLLNMFGIKKKTKN